VYYYLSREVKRRFIEEMREIFKEYPGLQKMKVSDKFPYQERPQYGLVVKNVSGNPIPLAGDNFIGTVISHCFLAKLKGKKGLLLDWVRENPEQVTVFVEEDLSSQVDGSSREFLLQHFPTIGSQSIELAQRGDRAVEVLVNGKPFVVPMSFQSKKIILPVAPAMGTNLVAKYYRRGLADAGLYYVEVMTTTAGSATVMVDTLLDYESIIIESATGAESSFSLPHFPVHDKTFSLIENDSFVMTEGVHYTINLQTGVVTFLNNPEDPTQKLRPTSSYRVQYKYQGPSFGPFTVKPSSASYDIIPGVTLAFSNWLEVGDKQVVIVSPTREEVSQEYGGHFEVSLSLDIYSRDPVQRELIADLLAVKVFGEIKPRFDSQGLAIVSVSLNGESEDIYDENTDTVYYMAGMDVSFNTDWRLYAPMIPKIKTLSLDVEVVQSLNDFRVSFSQGESIK
jgi:hypothetical protein